ncbi:FtsX-like permease family protein, partial [bacterium]|nr:FtsX-like permease family protein [bacterium]
KNKLRANSHILNVAATSTIPGIERDISFPIKAEGVSDDLDINFHNMLVDHDFVQTFEMEVLSGRDFDKTFTADTNGSFVLNETAVAALGWESPLHKRIEMHAVDSGRDKKGRVIGVVKDFHFRSLHHKIDPLILTVSPQAYYLDNLAVRVHPSNVSPALQFIEEKWREVVPNRPFEYQFLDSVFEEMYRKEQKLSEMFNYFAALAIFVGCLGLFGLASYTAEQRTKEIGIRKVLGASPSKIVLMLSKELVTLIALAFMIASPVAYYAMNRWLQEFVYKVNLDLLTFIWSGALALVIALLTISYQALKAALANPVDALRYQ